MKVLHLISSGGMYGAEAVILNLSRTLAEAGHASVVASFSNASNPNLQLHSAAVNAGIGSHTIHCRGQMDRSALASIHGLVKQTGADVVHAHGYKADIYCYLALRKMTVPLVSTCHTWYDNDLLVTLYGKADRLVLRRFARVVAVSAEVKQRLLDSGVLNDKIRIVRNGIDLRPFAEARPSLRAEFDDNTLLVGLIGRLASEKGVDVFLSAVARVAVEFPGAKFVVVGEGPDGEKLERLIDELKIRDSVWMLGRRDDMASVYASLDLMVSSSRQEGLPMAILEGMASGLPLVATAVGEVPTVVRDGVTGLVVPADDVERLAGAMVQLLRDVEKRKQFGAAGRKLIADEYSAERMAADYLAVYGEAIAAVKR
jgi:glycosyltransferase involved in cell wall biosynthesis